MKTDFLPECKIDIHPNPNCASIYTRFYLTDRKYYSDSILPEKKDIRIIKNPLAKEIIHQIFQINGIKTIYCDPYEIGITKAECFTWDEIFKKIKPILIKYLPVVY